MKLIKNWGIFVVLFTMLFFSMCDNKSDLQSDRVSEQTNPYDYIGDLHNQAMKDGLKEFYNSTIKQNIVPNPVDLDKFSNDFTVSFMEKEIVKRVKVSDVKVLRENLQTSLNYSNKRINTLLRSGNSGNNMNYEIANSQMSDFQKEKITAIINILESYGENIAEDLQKLEKDILLANVLEEEKDPVWAVLAITKSSLSYWTEHVISAPTNNTQLRATSPEISAVRLVEVQNDIYIEVQGESLRGIIGSTLKADALGAIGGIIGGVIGGHAAGGLIFGPGGVVLTLAADAVIGGISSSIVGGVGAGFGWW